MKAVVVLQAAALADEEGRPSTEVLLRRAGLDINEIAEILGKSYAAVAKAISRARSAPRKGRPTTDMEGV
ncbi:sigma factor-like helix-turn-helix DNA-binding protein [Sulfurifustis variabilis]|uniref:sigma factor-like helix-turn-helix DNA-binding protein n=1 Tax=Sulfurifustis variabilis TaxID=1675686 RepID=UPI003B831772